MGDMTDYYDDRDLQEVEDFYPDESPRDQQTTNNRAKPKRKRRSPSKGGEVKGTNNGVTVDVVCKNCGSVFNARVADRKRGWAKYCSKSCKASKQYERTGRQW